MRNRKQRMGLAFAVLAASSGGVADAGVDTTTFNVSASIVDACDVQAVNLAFGAYSPSAVTALNGASTVSVYCTVGTTYQLSLNVGTGGGDFTGRKMLSGAHQLTYNLYTTAARTTVWGDGTSSTATVSGTGTGLLTAVNHTVYGQIGVNQDSAPGAYSSTVTVTVSF